MRTISYQKIIDALAAAFIEANCTLPADVKKALVTARAAEESSLGRDILDINLKNADLAADEHIPICQDTGIAVVFVKMGNIHIKGGKLADAVNEGVRRGYKEGYLRKSVISDPLLNRQNSGDNTPAVIHYEPAADDSLIITVLPKGAGAENMSALAMLKPADGVKGVSNFVTDTVISAGGNPCPPVIVGVGIGGNFEKAAELSKRALLRKIGSSHPDPGYADLEKQLLNSINKSGVGPQGLGGRVTALAVHIETYPCHMACLPVAVNLNCHAARHKTVIL
ncbi:MAG TPA: fumarate hydratase [Spirochaetota bacterium]|nr:fumarate hydratase [Spirochaetota bacterium]